MTEEIVGIRIVSVPIDFLTSRLPRISLISVSVFGLRQKFFTERNRHREFAFYLIYPGLGVNVTFGFNFGLPN